MEVLVKTTGARLDGLVPTLTSLLCLLPLVVFWNRFRNLYWFHDDWDLLSEMQMLGLTDWMLQRYGENFAPVFNVLWREAILLLAGSYFGMILVLWGTHLAILLLLAALLRRCGFSWQSQSLAVLTLGMPWSNIESLGWAACWVSLLPTLFFLLAWVLLFVAESEGGSNWLTVLAGVGALASALSFSRGVLTGALLAFFVFCTSPGERLSRRQLWIAVGFASISVVTLFPYRWMVQGYSNFQGVNVAKLASMASYSVHYALLSPLYHLLPIPHKAVGLRELMIAGTCKVLVEALGIWLSEGKQRTLLWTLLLLDMGMAGLLGMGRFHLGVETAVSYRYQHLSLLCFAPFLALAVLNGIEGLGRPAARQVAFAVFFAGWTGLLGYPWARHSERWSQWRGTDVKNALVATPSDQRFGLPSITAGRARELIQIYGLH